MEPKPMIHVVITQCSPQIEEEYSAWLADIHVPMLLEFKGLKGAAKYKLVSETQPYVPGSVVNTPGGYSKYMLILEFDNREDFEAYEASPELAAASEEARTHDWHGLMEKKRRVQYELVKNWKR